MRTNSKIASVNSFETILHETQVEFVSHMTLGDSIALNEALLENLFMLLVSILNQIPIFGKFVW